MTGNMLQDTFKAWIDKMPGAGGKLIVIGVIEYPTSGWAASLREAVPQGINPSVLILDAVEKAPPGVVLDVISRVEVRFEKENAGSYRQVTIRSRSQSFTTEVEEVH